MNLFTSAFPQRLFILLLWCFFFSLLPCQTCMGKDVTLHVSASNPAMLLYQKFGFKTEEYILDFYDKYYPLDSKECKHAFFLRLRRWSTRATGGSVKSPACRARYYRGFQQRMLAVTWELERTLAFFDRTSNINSAMLCAASAIQEDWFTLSEGQAQKCQQKHAEATERQRFLCSFPDTLEIATGEKGKKKKNPKNKNTRTCHFRGAPWISNFETYPKLQGFCLCFVYGKWTSKLKSSTVFLWFDCSVRSHVWNPWRGIQYQWHSWIQTLGKLCMGQNSNTEAVF